MAVKWLHKAAEQNDGSAQYDLGLMYFNGQGILAQDKQQTLFWIRKAAANDSILAKQWLKEFQDLQ
ncbi:MAG: hypothetical protein AB2990_06270 [Candidatus Symbiodolus clandestinus]